LGEGGSKFVSFLMKEKQTTSCLYSARGGTKERVPSQGLGWLGGGEGLWVIKPAIKAKRKKKKVRGGKNLHQKKRNAEIDRNTLRRGNV